MTTSINLMVFVKVCYIFAFERWLSVTIFESKLILFINVINNKLLKKLL